MFAQFLTGVIVETNEVGEIQPNKLAVEDLRRERLPLRQLLRDRRKSLLARTFLVLVLPAFGSIAPFEFGRRLTKIDGQKTINLHKRFFFDLTKSVDVFAIL